MPDKLFRELADNAPVMIWRSARDRRPDWVNRRWVDFVGGDVGSSARGDWLEHVHPDDSARVAGAYDDAFARRAHISMTFRMRRSDGEWRTMVYNGAPFNRDGAFAGYFGSCADVSEQQETYNRLEQAYRERDSMLREVYHRVKNNLQQIDGLIALEAAALDSIKAREALMALSGRIQAMGRVHQMLLHSRDLTHIPTQDFIQSLCKSIGAAAGAGKRGIEIVVEVSESEIDIERAVVKGLVVNELVANSLKHAFPAGRSGKIVVRFERMADGGSILEVEDDGVGIEATFASQTNSAHIGMSLVTGLVAQLDGKTDMLTPPSGGCLARVYFPPRSTADR